MIQLALSDRDYRHALRDILHASHAPRVRIVKEPDPERREVLVLDREHLRAVASPISHPERIVMIAGNRNEDLDLAWNAGLQSVVLRHDPLGTALLAVLSAYLHVSSGAPWQT